jgi:hypothetical protein
MNKILICVIIISIPLIAINSISIQCSNNCAKYKKSHPHNFCFSVVFLVISILLLLGSIAGIVFYNDLI